MYILPIEFSRKKGDRDKKKRSRRQKLIIATGSVIGAGLLIGKNSKLIRENFNRSVLNSEVSFLNLKSKSKKDFAQKMRVAKEAGLNYQQGMSILEREQKSFLKKTIGVGNGPYKRLALDLGIYGGAGALIGGQLAGSSTKEGKEREHLRKLNNA